MQTLCVSGVGAPDVVRELADRLSDAGRVAIVDYTPDSTIDEPVAAPDKPTPAATTAIRVAADGTWVGHGTDQSPMNLLDSLATDYDYALIAGFRHHRLPVVLIGNAAGESGGDTKTATGSDTVAAAGDTADAATAANVVATAESADEVDLDALRERLDESEPHITLDTLVERAKGSPLAERSGAIATFTGRVRTKDSADDARTEQLTFEKYAGVAAERMDAISAELAERDGVFDVHMHHRVGTMRSGEDIVFVVVLAGHREEAFRTVEDGINRLKDEVPIFKKETTEADEFWLHEKA